jgi:hypothetical protein
MYIYVYLCFMSMGVHRKCLPRNRFFWDGSSSESTFKLENKNSLKSNFALNHAIGISIGCLLMLQLLALPNN